MEAKDRVTLGKAIQIARDNGFLKNDERGAHPIVMHEVVHEGGIPYIEFAYKVGKSTVYYTESIPEVLFAHDFMKALCGTENHKSYMDIEGQKYVIEEPAFLYHIAQMAKHKNPVKYLKRCL